MHARHQPRVGTDAASFVESDGLAHQVALARGDADVMVGTVQLVGGSPQLDAAWTATYADADGRRHVHGAHLGVRANVCLRRWTLGGAGDRPLGGYPGQDQRKRVGRAPGSFGRYLNRYGQRSGAYSERNTAVTRPNTVA